MEYKIYDIICDILYQRNNYLFCYWFLSFWIICCCNCFKNDNVFSFVDDVGYGWVFEDTETFDASVDVVTFVYDVDFWFLLSCSALWAILSLLLFFCCICLLSGIFDGRSFITSLGSVCGNSDTNDAPVVRIVSESSYEQYVQKYTHIQIYTHIYIYIFIYNTYMNFWIVLLLVFLMVLYVEKDEF